MNEMKCKKRTTFCNYNYMNEQTKSTDRHASYRSVKEKNALKKTCLCVDSNPGFIEGKAAGGKDQHYPEKLLFIFFSMLKSSRGRYRGAAVKFANFLPLPYSCYSMNQSFS